VPVSAAATAQPVATPSSRSRSATGEGWVVAVPPPEFRRPPAGLLGPPWRTGLHCSPPGRQRVMLSPRCPADVDDDADNQRSHEDLARSGWLVAVPRPRLLCTWSWAPAGAAPSPAAPAAALLCRPTPTAHTRPGLPTPPGGPASRSDAVCLPCACGQPSAVSTGGRFCAGLLHFAAVPGGERRARFGSGRRAWRAVRHMTLSTVRTET
jgi:hypothetical protein